MTEDQDAQNQEQKAQSEDREVASKQEYPPLAADFARILALSPEQIAIAQQIERDVRAGKIPGDPLSFIKALHYGTGDISFRLRHPDETSEIFKIEPLPEQKPETAEDLAKVEEPIVAAFANIHHFGSDMPDTAHVALIRGAAGGRLSVGSPSADQKQAYKDTAIRQTRPPGGTDAPSWTQK